MAKICFIIVQISYCATFVLEDSIRVHTRIFRAAIFDYMPANITHNPPTAPPENVALPFPIAHLPDVRKLVQALLLILLSLFSPSWFDLLSFFCVSLSLCGRLMPFMSVVTMNWLDGLLECVLYLAPHSKLVSLRQKRTRN